MALRIALGTLAPVINVRPDILSAAALLRQAHHEELRTVFFGSSRLQSAILPDVWARDEHVALRQVVNLAVNDGRLWDALYMLRQGDGLPTSVDLVVIELSPWEFNRNVRHPAGSAHLVPDQVRYWGDLADRLAVDDVTARAGLLADYVWPLSQRRRLEQWIGPNLAPLPSAPAPPIQHTDPSAAANLAKLDAFRAENIAGKHFFEPEISTFTERNLSLLLDAVRTVPGREVILLQVPARSSYLHILDGTPRGRAFYEAVQRLADSHTDANTHVLIWRTPQDCSLGDDIFIDYGHLSRAGAKAFTNRLYEEVSRRAWLPAPSRVGSGFAAR